MTKILIGILILFGFALLCSYFFIPAKINLGKVVYINGNINSANRFIYDERKWSKWWPGETQDPISGSVKNETYHYKNYVYIINRKMFEGMDIQIEHRFGRINIFLQTFRLNTDTIAIEWNGELPETYNPFKKISNYLLAIEVKKNISEILESAKIFLENKDNIYVLHIIQERVKDTILISTKYLSNTNPSTASIYNLIKNLKEYISFQKAAETNYPMLNIKRENSVFKTMIAIPINRPIAENEKFVLKRMVPGKILVAEVKGGAYTIREAISQLEIYMDDNHLSSPAISFESLITNRMEEPDTLKWITKIYYPVF